MSKKDRRKSGKKEYRLLLQRERHLVLILVPFIKPGCRYQNTTVLYTLLEKSLLCHGLCARIDDQSLVLKLMESPGHLFQNRLIVSAGNHRCFHRRRNIAAEHLRHRQLNAADGFLYLIYYLFADVIPSAHAISQTMSFTGCCYRIDSISYSHA